MNRRDVLRGWLAAALLPAIRFLPCAGRVEPVVDPWDNGSATYLGAQIDVRLLEEMRSLGYDDQRVQDWWDKSRKGWTPPPIFPRGTFKGFGP